MSALQTRLRRAVDVLIFNPPYSVSLFLSTVTAPFDDLRQLRAHRGQRGRTKRLDRRVGGRRQRATSAGSIASSYRCIRSFSLSLSLSLSRFMINYYRHRADFATRRSCRLAEFSILLPFAPISPSVCQPIVRSLSADLCSEISDAGEKQGFLTKVVCLTPFRMCKMRMCC